MWEHVASFSHPKVVCELEHVCKDVAEHLAVSNTGTHLMQRYWNALWAKLSWDEELIASEKKYLLPASLKRSEGKKSWKKMYAEEIPFWVQKTLQGVGVNNNASNEAKTLFKVEQQNANLTGEQLAAMERAAAKQAVERLIKNRPVGRTSESAGGDGDEDSNKPKKGRGPRPSGPIDASVGYQRFDYKRDDRAGTRQGKHKKGGVSKWSGFADDGVYE
ncbi:hypothetical protein STCU_02004 [Strigomonas culicis]|nr:hypothetical protein STCU_02004 [Strigomonas culicis]|eukprot:EPY33762.1 hypothetical protein STCU_02004 [Strigomonas culicis]